MLVNSYVQTEQNEQTTPEKQLLSLISEGQEETTQRLTHSDPDPSSQNVQTEPNVLRGVLKEPAPIEKNNTPSSESERGRSPNIQIEIMQSPSELIKAQTKKSIESLGDMVNFSSNTSVNQEQTNTVKEAGKMSF